MLFLHFADDSWDYVSFWTKEDVIEELKSCGKIPEYDFDIYNEDSLIACYESIYRDSFLIFISDKKISSKFTIDAEYEDDHICCINVTNDKNGKCYRIYKDGIISDTEKIPLTVLAFYSLLENHKDLSFIFYNLHRMPPQPKDNEIFMNNL